MQRQPEVYLTKKKIVQVLPKARDLTLSGTISNLIIVLAVLVLFQWMNLISLI
jgi:hypothetical protein